MLRAHVELFVDDDPSAFAFTGTRGDLLRRGNFNARVGWPQAVERLGVPGLHFHDLRHAGLTTQIANHLDTDAGSLVARSLHEGGS